MKTGDLPPYYLGPFENCQIKSIRRTGQRVEVAVSCAYRDGTIVFTEVHAVHAKNAEGMFFTALAEYENDGPGRYFEFPNSREDGASLAIEAGNVKFKGR